MLAAATLSYEAVSARMATGEDRVVVMIGVR